MKKSFTLKTLTAAIVSTMSFAAVADTYQVEPIETLSNYRSSVPQGINASGQIVGVARFPENIEIDFNYVPDQLLSQIGYDPEGTEPLTDEQYQVIVDNLSNLSNNSLQYQRIGLDQAVIYNGTSNPVDAAPVSESEFASSVDSYFYSINNANTAVGVTTGPFEITQHTYTNSEDEQVTDEYFKADFLSRGVWFNNGVSALVTPQATDYLGGESAVFDINDNGLAVGYESVALSPAATTQIQENCEDPENASAAQPLYVCVWSLWRNLQTADASNIAATTSYSGPYNYNRARSGYNAGRSIYDIRGQLWQFDASGEVISQTELPTLVERQSDDERDFSSYGYAVNNNRVAVGQSWTYHPSRGAIRMPAIFLNGEALPVTENPEYLWGAATDINNNGIAVGYLTQRPAGTLRSYGFYYDVEARELTELSSFFNGSSTVIRSINDNGEMVGTAEVDPTLSQVRARAGFYYNMNAETPQFIDLNNTISCDSPYNIVDANDITDNGEIIATALKSQEYTDSDGEIQTREILVTVKLDPVSGELNNCTNNEEPIERQGAAIGLWSILGFSTLGLLITGIRRRAFLKTKKS
ncbi:DUF3466 family protein [Idiomarina sp. HP20-50]|uniref:DUF3466 family protein n=1 Tax=Idiomarina sp. HP20-50 TaxID=3070813 RepID=UPI00294B0E23|nr:DUF3466 family protein [Idiomarina sp. HP20-50]MDV6315118.1 DUF3466 family protein [Idiomarina sp. HP20-50]